MNDMAQRRSTPLGRQLIAIALSSTGLALLVAFTLLFAAEVTSLKAGMVRDVSIKANIIGNQCSASLLFNVQKDAEETLAALNADRHVEFAAVYGERGGVFASYRSERSNEDIPPEVPFLEGYRFGRNHLTVVRQIFLHEERIGAVLIRSDLRPLSSLLLRYGAAVGIVLVISLLVAYALLARLQRSVTGPVTGLVRLMERISREKDFTARAAVTGPQELGSLADGLNAMLEAIQARDRDLERHQKDLERSVESLQRTSAELQEANRKLETLDRLKSDFISIVSHELRTPLTSIKAFVELIRIKPNMAADRKARLLETINSETERLGRLINDLLDLSRIESGTMKWNDEDLVLDEIVRSSMAGIMPLAEQKKIAIFGPGGGPLPPVRVDRDRMTQVIANILSNAIKFTPENGTIRITARTEGAPDPRVQLSISDSGPGISPEDIDLIFDKFHRGGDMLTSTIEGTGLGLSIARQIIEHYGGRIWAESERGKGSTFTISLPHRG